MERIFKICDEANIRVNLYRSDRDYGPDERWSCSFEGANPSEGQELKAGADATDAKAAVELAWHRFTRLTAGEPKLKQLVSR